MKRFLMFPVILGMLGAFFIVICAVQGILPQIPYINVFSVPGRISIWKQLSDLFFDSWKYGLITGFILGFLLAAWDFIRNPRSNKLSSFLIFNLLFCIAFGFILTTFNMALMYGVSLYYAKLKIKPPTLFLIWPFFSAAVLNFTAIMWAAIRSITTDDILTPRVLLAKLRDRSRLN